MPSGAGLLAAVIGMLLLGQPIHAGIVTDNGPILNSCGLQDPIESDIRCGTDNTVAIQDIHNYTFQVKPGSKFSITIELRSLGFNADADLYLYGPNGMTRASTQRIGNDVITLPPSVVVKSPGMYTLQVMGYQTYSYYNLEVRTRVSFPKLVADEALILRHLFDQCCDDNETTLAPVCGMLKKASDPTREESDDICSTPPNECNDDGELTKLSLVGGDGGNLVCPYEFPFKISGFKQLRELDMSSNNMIGGIRTVSKVTNELLYLKKLNLKGNSFEGELDCDLMNHSTLKILWLGRNMLNGTLPDDCTSNNLEQLSLDSNMLYGTMPRSWFMKGSQLTVIDLSKNNIAVETNGPALKIAGGISGSIPTTVSFLENLLYFDVSSNSLEGTIPDFAVKLQTLNVANNKLKGKLPPSLAYLPHMRSLNISHNNIGGSVPSMLGSLASLMTLALNDNSLTGGIEPYWQNQLLRVFDVSNNDLKYEMPYSPLALPNLQQYNVAGNQMRGNITKMGDHVARSMVFSEDGHNQLMVLNLSGNILSGEIPHVMAHARLFHFIDPAATIISEFWDPVSPKMQSTFDISKTGLKATFPSWLVPELQELYSLGNGNLGYAQVIVSTGNELACPKRNPEGTGESYFMIEEKFDMTCLTSDNKKVRPSVALGLSVAFSPPPGSVSAPPPSNGDGDGGGGGSVGAIIGAIVGVLVLIGAAIGGWFWWKKKKSEKRGRHSSRRVPLTFNSAYDPTTMSEASGMELYHKHGESNMMNAHVNPIYNR